MNLIMNSKKKEQVVFQLPDIGCSFQQLLYGVTYGNVPVSDVDTQNPQYNRDATVSRFREC